MASLTQWTWVWVNSGSWWWTGRPSVLQFMGLQRVRHDWVTELTDCNRISRECMRGGWNHLGDHGRILLLVWIGVVATEKEEREPILKLVLVPSTGWPHVFFYPYDQEFNATWGIWRRTSEIREKYRHKEWGFKNKTILRPFLSVWNYLTVRKVGEIEDFYNQVSRWSVQTTSSRRLDLHYQADRSVVVRRFPRC